MARRSDHTREELHGMFLEAALATTREHGVDAVTARSLATAIGYSPGTIYQVFENLDDVIVQLKVIILDQLIARLDEAPARGTPEQRILALVGIYVAFAAQEAHLWHALFEAGPPSGAALPDSFGGHISRGLARVEKELVPLFKAGDKAGPARAATTIWAGLHGIIALARSTAVSRASGQDAAALARDFARTYLAGIAARRT